MRTKFTDWADDSIEVQPANRVEGVVAVHAIPSNEIGRISVWLTPKQARKLARALCRRADQAEGVA